MENKITLDVAQQLIDLYDNELEEIKGLKDEALEAELDIRVDSLLNVLPGELSEALNQLILYNNINTERRLLAEKEEKKTKAIISRIMHRLGKMDYQCQDGKVVGKPKLLREYKEGVEVPREYMMNNTNGISGKIAKGEIFDFVKPIREVIAFIIKK